MKDEGKKKDKFENNNVHQFIHQSYEKLENKDSYTIQDAANLLLKSPIAIRQAVRRGELHGLMLDHHVVSISRQAILDWLHNRPGRL